MNRQEATDEDSVFVCSLEASILALLLYRTWHVQRARSKKKGLECEVVFDHREMSDEGFERIYNA